MSREALRRRTFGIISHPDAGKTTLTEKLLLFGGAIQMAGAVKAKKAQRHATSDWMEVERERGISVSSSVMVARGVKFPDLYFSCDKHWNAYGNAVAADILEPYVREALQSSPAGKGN